MTKRSDRGDNSSKTEGFIRWAYKKEEMQKMEQCAEISKKKRKEKNIWFQVTNTIKCKWWKTSYTNFSSFSTKETKKNQKAQKDITYALEHEAAAWH